MKKPNIDSLKIVRAEWIRCTLRGELDTLKYIESENFMQVSAYDDSPIIGRDERQGVIRRKKTTSAWYNEYGSKAVEDGVRYKQRDDRVIVSGTGCLVRAGEKAEMQNFVEEWQYNSRWMICRLILL